MYLQLVLYAIVGSPASLMAGLLRPDANPSQSYTIFSVVSSSLRAVPLQGPSSPYTIFSVVSSSLRAVPLQGPSSPYTIFSVVSSSRRALPLQGPSAVSVQGPSPRLHLVSVGRCQINSSVKWTVEHL